MEKYNTRKDVPEKYKWNLEDFFKNDKEFNKTLSIAKEKVDKLKEYSGYVNDSKKLNEYLDNYFECVRLLENLYIYAHLINDQELGISENQSRLNDAFIIAKDIDINTAFFVPELLTLSHEQYTSLFIENPELEEYKAYLDVLFREKEHTLTENEEKIVSELVNSAGQFDEISSTLLNSEHNYGTIKLDDGTEEVVAVNNYRRLMKNKNDGIRKKVYNQFNKKLDEYASTNASLLNSYVSLNNSTAKIRHFDSAWDKKLFSYNVSNKVYETLIDVTERNLDVLQKYYDLKKRILNFDVLHKYDLNLDICECDKLYSIEDAQTILLNTLQVLGDDYIKYFKKMFDNRYIDYCQYKGKVSGAYSSCPLDKPSRICMSYNYDLDSISTIAHEGGHHVNFEKIHEANPLQYRSISMLQAEVASLLNECLLSDYIYKNGATKEEKLAGLDNIIRVIASNLYGAVREGKMEQDMYKHIDSGGVLTKEYLGNLSLESLKKYYGDKVEIDEYFKNDWILRSHYYYNFYLYSYAVSMSVASSVASKILSGDKDILEKYYKFLSLGDDVWPIDAYKVLGVDLECEDTYISAIEYFNELLDKFEKLYYDEEV